VIDKLIQINAQMESKGEKIDPLWTISKENIVKYLQYQAMPPNGADQKDWRSKNKWYRDFQQKRSEFFDSLPNTNPNKSKAPIEYPEPSPEVKALQDKYFKITDSGEKSRFIRQNPQLQEQFDKQTDYYNNLRVAQGYAPFKEYPKASTQVQNFIDKYMASDKSMRKALRNSNPDLYQKMAAYFDSTSLYGINEQGSLSQLQGQPDTTSKQLKQISGLARDIYQNADGTYSIVPAGWMKGLSNSSSYRRGGRRGRKVKGLKSNTRSIRSLRLKPSGLPTPSVRLAKFPAIKRSSAKPLAKVSTISKVRLRSNA
jgi:hypothetical protein